MKKTHLMITIGILSVLMGSIAIGFAFSANEMDFLPFGEEDPDDLIYVESNLSETDIEALLLTIPEIQDFLGQFAEVELYLYFDYEYETWYAFYFAVDDYMSYASVVIDDTTGAILWIEVFIASDETNLTADEVLNIALLNEQVQEFVSAYPDYEVYLYYDYYQYWYVDFYGDYFYSWCSLIIDDTTGDIIEVYSSDDLYETNLTIDEVVDIALTDSDVQQFIIDNPDYEMYVYLTEFYDTYDTEITDPWEMGELSEGLNWIVGFYTMDPENWQGDWIEVWIDDATGEIIDKWMSIPATKTETEIFTIANSTVEVQEFLAMYDDVEWDLWYDGFGTWYVWAWSSIQFDAYVFIEIDDLTGEILWIESYIPVPPNHDESEVLAIVLSLTEVVDFMNDNPDYEIYLFFYDGLWYADIYSMSLSSGIWVTLDDVDLTVLLIESYDFFGPPEVMI